MVKGSIGDRILECIGYPESWTEQEIEDTSYTGGIFENRQSCGESCCSPAVR